MKFFRLLAPALVLSALAFAQEDPPSRVARLSYISGAVSFEPASLDEWTAATLNYPMTTGDRIYTDSNSRASMGVGSNFIRLGERTNFQFLNLDDRIAQMSLTSGSINLRIRRISESDSWEVDTPNGAILINGNGEYRIDSDPDRNAIMVTVRRGDVDVKAGNGGFSVRAGQTAYFGPDGEPDIRSANGSDDFDQFVYARDRVEDVPPPRYVSQDMVGWQDLDRYGSWSDASDYGPVWYPQVAAGWSPYHDGRWAWVEPWGWTWVDDAPWGFAPFHYGRWAYIGSRWGWCPGPVSVRPVYAPALVAFVGGSNWGLSIGVSRGPAVGWFPLGPREPYIPAYHVSPTYVRQVNVTNVNVTNINLTNINYVNRNAVVVVPQQQFVSAAPVQRNIIRVEPQQIQQVKVMQAAPVIPNRASLLARSAPVRAPQPPANIVNRTVVVRNTPPPAPVPFQARQQFLERNPGRPVDPGTLRAIQQQNPGNVAQRVQFRPAGSQPQAGGVNQPQRAGSPNGSAQQIQRVDPAARFPQQHNQPQRQGFPSAPAPQMQRTDPAARFPQQQNQPQRQRFPSGPVPQPQRTAPVERFPQQQNQAQPQFHSERSPDVRRPDSTVLFPQNDPARRDVAQPSRPELNRTAPHVNEAPRRDIPPPQRPEPSARPQSQPGPNRDFATQQKVPMSRAPEARHEAPRPQQQAAPQSRPQQQSGREAPKNRPAPQREDRNR
jgi:hypothetical protein